jgi:hypothetical protein
VSFHRCLDPVLLHSLSCHSKVHGRGNTQYIGLGDNDMLAEAKRLGFLDEFRLQLHRSNAVDLAIDIVITLD